MLCCIRSSATLCKCQNLSLDQRDTLFRSVVAARWSSRRGSSPHRGFCWRKLKRKVRIEFCSQPLCGLKLTRQELIQSSNPVVCVLIVSRLEPHEGALDVRLWGHWSETKSGIRADQAIVEQPLRFTLVQCLVEHSKNSGEEASESSIENHVEKEDFCCKEGMGTVSLGVGRVLKGIFFCKEVFFREVLLLLGKWFFQANISEWMGHGYETGQK